MLRERIPNGRWSKGKWSAAHFWSDIKHNKKILVGRSERSWRNVWCNQIINVCWLLELKILKVSVSILNSIREETGSQWSLWSTGEIWSNRLADRYIVRAREFWTTWRRFMEDFGSPFESELQYSSFDITNKFTWIITKEISKDDRIWRSCLISSEIRSSN